MKNNTSENEQGIVIAMRAIRDEISNEIKDMTFEEERAFLDNLLSGGISKKTSTKKISSVINS